MKIWTLAVLGILLMIAPVLPQTQETGNDTVLMSKLISGTTGIVTTVTVLRRQNLYDIDIEFNGYVKDYRSAMCAVIGAVGHSTKESTYRTEWCYITTRELGVQRILTRDIRKALQIALDGDLEACWRYFTLRLQTEPWNAPKGNEMEAMPDAAAAAVASIADFEKSSFYRRNGILKDTDYALRNGEHNHCYDIPGKRGLLLEVQTAEEIIVGAGATFIEGAPLSSDDIALVVDLLRCVTHSNWSSDITSFVESGCRKEVFQIKQAPSKAYAGWRVYAGMVGPDPVVVIERVN